MSPQESLAAAKQVLADAADAPHLLDLSDAERLIWMLEKAHQLGRAAANTNAERVADGEPCLTSRRSCRCSNGPVSSDDPKSL